MPSPVKRAFLILDKLVINFHKKFTNKCVQLVPETAVVSFLIFPMQTLLHGIFFGKNYASLLNVFIWPAWCDRNRLHG
jgi:hypothetical protein